MMYSPVSETGVLEQSNLTIGVRIGPIRDTTRQIARSQIAYSGYGLVGRHTRALVRETEVPFVAIVATTGTKDKSLIGHE